MGAVIAEVSGEADRKTDEKGRGRADGTDTCSTHSENGRAGSDRVGGDRVGSAAETKEAELEGLLVVDQPKKKKTREEINAERRRKYAEEKAKNGGTVKPRKVTKAKKPETQLELNGLIQTVFTIVASREGMSHWALTDAEVAAISEPLSKILSESEAFSELNEHSDIVALVIACATILLPRLFVTLNQTKGKNKDVRRINEIKQNSERANLGDVSKSDKKNTSSVSYNDSWLRSIGHATN